MKASKLIERLQEEIEKHGDLPVRHGGHWIGEDVDAILIYDADGNDPSATAPAVEIYLH